MSQFEVDVNRCLKCVGQKFTRGSEQLLCVVDICCGIGCAADCVVVVFWVGSWFCCTSIVVAQLITPNFCAG